MLRYYFFRILGTLRKDYSHKTNSFFVVFLNTRDYPFRDPRCVSRVDPRTCTVWLRAALLLFRQSAAVLARREGEGSLACIA